MRRMGQDVHIVVNQSMCEDTTSMFRMSRDTLDIRNGLGDALTQWLPSRCHAWPEVRCGSVHKALSQSVCERPTGHVCQKLRKRSILRRVHIVPSPKTKHLSITTSCEHRSNPGELVLLDMQLRSSHQHVAVPASC